MRMVQAGELAQLDADLKLATGLDRGQQSRGGEPVAVRGRLAPSDRLSVRRIRIQVIVGPAVVVIMAMLGHAITLPEFDFTKTSTILLAMLGLGRLRSVEKVKGV
jgi:hypothetical protein